jgi:hypothetical protein
LALDFTLGFLGVGNILFRIRISDFGLRISTHLSMISMLPNAEPLKYTGGTPVPLRRNRFVLTLAEGVRLVSLDTVRAARGLRAEEIIALAQNCLSPEYLPAFDMSFGGSGSNSITADNNGHSHNPGGEPRRLVHFWAGALEGTSDWRNLAQPGEWLDYIIADCLLISVDGLANPEVTVPSSQLVRSWGVSHQSILRYLRAGQLQGELVGRSWRVNRLSAVEFLRRRSL